MSRLTNREETLERLRASVSKGKIIVGGGAGIGLSARCLEDGEADLIIIYNSGRYRMAGRGSLAGLMPYGDANEIVVDMAKEVLPLIQKTAVLAGVCASDPFRHIPAFLRNLKAMGFAGVQNFPTVGLIDGQFRQHLEETGMGYDCEVRMIREAHSQGLLTTPYVFSAEEARRMTSAGADVLVAHMGLTTSGNIGALSGKTLDECVTLIQEISDTAFKINPDIIILCHGGPIAAPEDVKYVLSRTKRVHGFYGASSMERLPVEKAIVGICQEFKSLRPSP